MLVVGSARAKVAASKRRRAPPHYATARSAVGSRYVTALGEALP